MEHYGLQTAAGHLTVPAESKEPYAADVEAGFRADAAQIIARYPRPKSATIPLCHLAQAPVLSRIAASTAGAPATVAGGR